MKIGIVANVNYNEDHILDKLVVETNENGLLSEINIENLPKERLFLGDLVYVNEDSVTRVNDDLSLDDKSIVNELYLLKKQYLKRFKEIISSLEHQAIKQDHLDKPIRLIKRSIELQKFLVEKCLEKLNGDKTFIKNWEELAKLPANEKYKIVMNGDGCSGHIVPVDDNVELKMGINWIYLTSHTFYGPNYEESTKLLNKFGFNVQLDKLDKEKEEMKTITR